MDNELIIRQLIAEPFIKPSNEQRRDDLISEMKQRETQLDSTPADALIRQKNTMINYELPELERLIAKLSQRRDTDAKEELILSKLKYYWICRLLAIIKERLATA